MTTILEHIEDRDAFQKILDENTGIIIIKFGAEWCQPCKSISPYLKSMIEKLPNLFTVYDLDVDDNFEIYAYLKSKKMVSGIPSVLAYYKENKTFASNESISGVNQPDYEEFFKRCISHAISYN